MHICTHVYIICDAVVWSALGGPYFEGALIAMDLDENTKDMNLAMSSASCCDKYILERQDIFQALEADILKSMLYFPIFPSTRPHTHCLKSLCIQAPAGRQMSSNTVLLCLQLLRAAQMMSVLLLQLEPSLLDCGSSSAHFR